MNRSIQPYLSGDPTTGHRGYVRQVRHLVGTDLVATVGYDGSVRLSRLPDLRPVAAQAAHLGGAGALDALPDGRLVTAGADGTVRFWSTDDGVLTESASVPMPSLDEDPLIETASWLPDGSAALVGVVGGSVWEVDPVSGTCRFVDEDGLLSINAFVVSADGETLWLASDESTVRRYLRADGSWHLDATSEVFDDHVDALALHPSTGVLLATTHGRDLWRCDAPVRDLTFEHGRVGGNALNAVVWHGDKAIVGGDDHLVRVVDPYTFSSRIVGDVGRDIDSLAVADGHILAATTGALVALSLDAGVTARHQNVGAIGAICQHGRSTLVGLHDAPWILVGRLGPSGGTEHGRIQLPAPVSCALASSPWFGLADGHLVGLDVAAGRVARAIQTGAEVEGLASSVIDGKPLVVATNRAGVASVLHGDALWQIPVTDPGRRLKTVAIVERSGRPLALCAGKDHQLHAFWLDDPTGVAWTLAGSDCAARTFNDILVHGDRVYAACWDRRIHRLTLHDERAASPDAPALEGHDHAVERMVLCGELLVSVSYDGTLRTWERGRLHGTTRLGRMAVRRLIPSHTPGHVLAAGYAGTVFEVDPNTHTITAFWAVA